MNRICFGGSPICTYEYGIISTRRRDPETERILDEKFEALGNRRWRIKTKFSRATRLVGNYKRAYVIGKGKSADYLQASDLKDGVVLCCNEAVLIAEKLVDNVYGVRQDYAGGIRMDPVKATMIITDVLVPLYYEQERVILINPHDYVKDQGPTMNLCVGIARKLGAEEIIMYGFDAHMFGDFSYSSVANRNNLASDNHHLVNQPKPQGVKWCVPESYPMAR